MKDISTPLNLSVEGAALLAPRFGAVLLGLLIAACSASPPSDSDIKNVLDVQFGNMGGSTPYGDYLKMKVKSVSKLGCEKSGEAFLCDIEAEFLTIGGSTGKKTMRVRMIKSNSEWKGALSN